LDILSYFMLSFCGTKGSVMTAKQTLWMCPWKPGMLKWSWWEVKNCYIALCEESYSEWKDIRKTEVQEDCNPSGQDFCFQDLSMDGRLKVTSQRDDHMIKKMVVRSPTTLSKKIWSDLLLTGADVSTSTLKCPFSD